MFNKKLKKQVQELKNEVTELRKMIQEMYEETHPMTMGRKKVK